MRSGRTSTHQWTCGSLDPLPTERPFAGYFYFAYGLAQKSETTLDQLQAQLGVIGPDSLAEETQKFVHRVIGDTIPQGWDTQLHNEPAFHRR